MYKLVITFAHDEASDERQSIRSFETAVEARDCYNEHIAMRNVAFIEIFEVSKWDRQRLNSHAQLEEECENIGCDDGDSPR